MSILDLPDGIHPGLPESVYHEKHIGLVSKSALDEFARSPKRYRAWVDGTIRDEETPALAFGRAFHCAALEPDEYQARYVIEPDFGDCRKKENKAARDDWRGANAQRTLISRADAETIRGMVAALRSHRIASRILESGTPEVSALWTDKETGLRCKVRCDYRVAPRLLLADLKSTQDVSPEQFRRQVFAFGYERQHALYREAFAALGEPAEHFIFVGVEKTPPYDVVTYTLDDAAVQRGYLKVRACMRRLAECMASGTWPGVSDSIETLDTPPWLAKDGT